MIDHNEVITRKVIKRKDLLWDKVGTRTPNLNQERNRAWQEVRTAVFIECQKDLKVEQLKRCWRNKKKTLDLLHKENSYRNGTGGGLDMEIEKAMNRGSNKMSDMDVSIARLLGKEASFLGHRITKSNVVAACPPSTTSSPSPVATPEELNRQLSNFDSLSEEGSEDDDEPRGRRRRKPLLIREHLKLIKEQRELVRFQMMVLERENLMYIKMTEVLTTFLENRFEFSGGRRFPADEVMPHEVDPHLAESHISCGNCYWLCY